MKLSQNTVVGGIIVVVTLATMGSLISIEKKELRGDEVFANASDGIDATTARLRAECADDEKPQECLEAGILDLVSLYGPVEAIDTLNAFLHDGTMGGRGDYHDFVHRIGRLTAKKEGLRPDGFFLCPVDYNYGCQHGFFEQALVEEPDAKKAAEIICDPDLMKDKPLKFHFYCYHGVGHGIMMAKAYDLHGSLALCESFGGTDEQTGCFQGVFMENVVGYLNGTSQAGLFSETNRLAPCDAMEAKYQWQCYINLGGYLSGAAGSGPGAVERATEPCLNAGANIRVCLSAVGLTSTNPAWQPSLTPAYDPNDFIGNAVSICRHFPQDYLSECILAGIDNLAQFDREDTSRMIEFCSAFPDPTHREQCFGRIGQVVKIELPPGTLPEVICNGIPSEYLPSCLSGVTLG